MGAHSKATVSVSRQSAPGPSRSVRHSPPLPSTPLSPAAWSKEEELQRRCEMQERALERIGANFQHVVALVGKATGTSVGNHSSLDELLHQLHSWTSEETDMQEGLT